MGEPDDTELAVMAASARLLDPLINGLAMSDLSSVPVEGVDCYGRSPL